jgi:hypothetical protein
VLFYKITVGLEKTDIMTDRKMNIGMFWLSIIAKQTTPNVLAPKQQKMLLAILSHILGVTGLSLVTLAEGLSCSCLQMEVGA